ncbi:MAG: crossover junction endodeoxyribonuclease RuvC [bacterium]
MKIIKYLCLDQSTTKTGYAIFKDIDLIDYGLIEIKGKDSYKRILELKNTILKIIDKNQIETIGIEDVTYQGNIRGYRPLCELFGVLSNLFEEKEMLYNVVKPTEWRKSCGIQGRSKKKVKPQAIKFAKTVYGIDVCEDTAEAVCLGHHFVNNVKLEVNL